MVISKLHTDSSSVALRWDPEVNSLTGIPGDSNELNPWATPRKATKAVTVVMVHKIGLFFPDSVVFLYFFHYPNHNQVQLGSTNRRHGDDNCGGQKI